MSFLRHREIYRSDVAKDGDRGPDRDPRSSFAMSLEPAIPRRVGLHQSPPPLHRPIPCCTGAAETVNHHPAGGGEFSTGETGKFQPALTQRKKAARRERVPPALATRPNQCGSMDFVTDRILTVVAVHAGVHSARTRSVD